MWTWRQPTVLNVGTVIGTGTAQQGPTVRVHFIAGGAQWRSMAPSGAQWRKSAAVGGGQERKSVVDVGEFKGENYIIRRVSVSIEEALALVQYRLTSQNNECSLEVSKHRKCLSRETNGQLKAS